jgi:hypothetical protein
MYVRMMPRSGFAVVVKFTGGGTATGRYRQFLGFSICE